MICMQNDGHTSIMELGCNNYCALYVTLIKCTSTFLNEVNTTRIRGIGQKSLGAIFSNVVDEIAISLTCARVDLPLPCFSLFFRFFFTSMLSIRTSLQDEKSIDKFPLVLITRNSDILLLGQL